MILSFIGGTGPEGLGLALRFAAAGQGVILGSRQLDRAQAAAAKLRQRLPSAQVQGLENPEAVAAGEVVLVTVPYAAQAPTLAALREVIGEKVVVSTVVPLNVSKGAVRALAVPEGSAAEQAQGLLPRARVVGAFQNLSAGRLWHLEEELACDVVVCSDHPQAKGLVMELAEAIRGVRAIDGGPLASSRYLEALTALLLTVNRLYKAETNIRLVGL